MKQRLKRNMAAETRWCCFILSEDSGGRKQLEKKKRLNVLPTLAEVWKFWL
jgi:hypothetical protein